jgi:transposase
VSLPAAILMVALIGVVIAVVLSPLNAVQGPRRRRDSQERADLEARREAKYQEIRDAKLDYEMAKLSSEDHEAIDRELRGEALQILDEIRELEQIRELDRDQEAGASDGFLQQQDRVEHEQHSEEDGPAVEVALDHRAAAKRPGASADAEGA